MSEAIGLRVMTVPYDEAWVSRLRQGDWIWLVKEERLAHHRCAWGVESTAPSWLKTFLKGSHMV